MKTKLLNAIFPVVIIFLTIPQLFAQPYQQVDLKVNTSYTSDTISGVAQIIIDYPQNGNYSFDDVPGGFLLNYEPDSGFTGKDTVIIEYKNNSGGGIEYEVFFFHVKPSLIYLVNDYFPVAENNDYQPFDVLSNDHGTDVPFNLV